MSAVLKRAGNTMEIKRPVGWRGKKSQSWLEPEQAFPLIDNCYRIDPEFGLSAHDLSLYRRKAGRAAEIATRPKLDVRDAKGNPQPLLYIPDTKNGEPRPVHLPPILVEAFRAQPPRPLTVGHRPQDDAGVPWLDAIPGARLFRFHPGGHLRDMLSEAMLRTGLSFPRREGGFHIFCHTYGTWMRATAVSTPKGSCGPNDGRPPKRSRRYAHTVASYEARQADLSTDAKSAENPWKNPLS